MLLPQRTMDVLGFRVSDGVASLPPAKIAKIRRSIETHRNLRLESTARSLGGSFASIHHMMTEPQQALVSIIMRCQQEGTDPEPYLLQLEAFLDSFANHAPPKSAMFMYTDGMKSAAGCKLFAPPYSKYTRRLKIEPGAASPMQLELMAILQCLRYTSHKIRGCNLVVANDNISAIHALHVGHASYPELQEILKLAESLQISVNWIWIAGSHNIADVISRQGQIHES